MTIKAEIIRTFEDKGTFLASASVIFDGCFIVKNLRVIDGRNGIFVSMPNFKGRDGNFIDSCYPLNTETRAAIQQAVLEAYEDSIGG
jgi:stage V sporulation protein G